MRFENARPDNIVRLNGERCIGLSVYKEMQFNTVRVVDLITDQLIAIEQALPGYSFEVIGNQELLSSSRSARCRPARSWGWYWLCWCFSFSFAV